MSVYSGYIGKTIRRKDGFEGKVTNIITYGKNDTRLQVHIMSGKDTGGDTEIQLSFILSNRKVYTISD